MLRQQLVWVCALLAFAQSADARLAQKSFVIHRAEAAPVIDGSLDDEIWKQANIVDDFHQIDPQDGPPATEQTEVRALYDDHYLYVGVYLHDSQPAGIQATQMIQGQQYFSDDRFFFTLDSFNNKRNDYFFQTNPHGIRREALRENNSRFIEEWNTIWHVRTMLLDDGWSAEVAIPFKSISFDPQSDTWGINFGRVIPRKQEIDMWSSHERQDWPAYAGEVTGISGIQQGIGLDITPSLTVTSGNAFDGGDDSRDFEPSLDVLYRLTPSLNAALTLNTDFSTAAVDDQQVALDRFSLFFPEKRDFFLQDAGIFEFGNIDSNGRPFFSRRIGLAGDGDTVGLDAGAKLTGRVGGYSVGMLAVRQEAQDGIAAKDLVVARASANVLQQSSLGLIATYGDPTSDTGNSVIGADFLYQDPEAFFGQIMRGYAWLQQSNTDGLDGDDRAFGAQLEMPNDRLHARLAFLELQENFNPALGFVNRSGIRQYDAMLRWRWRPQSGRWRAINHRGEAKLVTDMDGRALSRTLALRPFGLYSQSTDWYMFEWHNHHEVIDEGFELFDRLPVPAGTYDFNRYRVEVATGMQRPVNVILSLQDGDFFGGERLEKYFELQWRQSQYLSMGLKFEEQDVRLPGGDFRLHLGSLRTDVAFNPRWSFSNLLQYDNNRNALGINSRLRYVPQAGREFLLVLNHGLDVDPPNRFSSRANEVNLRLNWTLRY